MAGLVGAASADSTLFVLRVRSISVSDGIDVIGVSTVTPVVPLTWTSFLVSVSTTNYPKKTYTPTLKEIGDNFGITIGTVQDHISALQKKGHLERKKDIARGFVVIKSEEEIYFDKMKADADLIPLYGNVAAGEPIFANDNIQGYVTMEKSSKGHNIHFAMIINGNR